ncbi:patatin-like phospholipase family protein [Stutzerimonas stutzeri]|uniref:patatin-like phospholipase family protein n=1 Tax=Stutzerimonas TaxID=2901164 RepID=UPI001BAE6BFA|nr:patatin-like phospholipase family protein [Stutzerimonas stutzeri]QUE77263.1 patatin-like phospholipase family protein [Stutzerimonas stutzeri]
MFTDHSLVLGGGGITGIAWMTGLLFGLSEKGLDLRECGRMLGTSAGATVAAQIREDSDLGELYERQVNASKQVQELAPQIRLLRLLPLAISVLPKLNAPIERTQRIGQLALRAGAGNAQARQAVIAARLHPRQDWPAKPLAVVAVDVLTGETRVFDRQSGVTLTDAVAASCAVPGIWPPVNIDGRQYMDGGIRSSSNADLAERSSGVIILSPLGVRQGIPGRTLARQIAKLEQAGTRVQIIGPDRASAAAMGRNPLNPTRRAIAAQAGREQDHLIATEYERNWR